MIQSTPEMFFCVRSRVSWMLDSNITLFYMRLYIQASDRVAVEKRASVGLVPVSPKVRHLGVNGIMWKSPAAIAQNLHWP